jgi:outer membrane protein assembly factor BamB
MHRTAAAVTLSAWLLVSLPAARAADWPQFRGPDGQGHSTSPSAAVTWSESENVTWKAALPGLGWSSPAIRGNQIWVTTAVDDGHSLRAIALDRKQGTILHDVEIFRLDDPGSIHSNNSHASPTPFIDGERIYVHYGAHGTACLASDGKIVWKTQELKYDHRHGPAGSPVVWRDLVFLNCDGTDVQFVVALDKHTGKIRWKHDRKHISEERKSGALQVPMAYSTPLMIEVDGRTQLVSLGSDAVVGHEPSTGEEIWWFRYSGYSNVATPVYDKGLMFVSSGFGEPTLYAFKVGGSGDITESNLVWKSDKSSVVPLDVSPLVVGDEIYTISDAGIAVCYDTASGKQRWQKRLGSKFWASPVVADGRIYCLDDSGKTTVIKPGTKFEELAANQLDGSTQASLAIVDGAIFLRTATHLYRIDDAGRAAK